MHNKEAIDMMTRLSHEITELRRQIDIFKPQAQAYQTIAGLIHLLAPPRSEGMAPDIMWELKKRIAQAQKELEAEANASYEVIDPQFESAMNHASEINPHT